MALKRLAFALALSLAAALGVTFSRPLSADGQAPSAPEEPRTPEAPSALGDALDVSADRLDVDVQAKTAVLSGNVKLSKGGMTVSCPRVDARYDDTPQITWAKGTGGVVAELKGVRAEAPEVEIDVPSQTLELRGGVRLARGGGFLRAERATVHMISGKVTMHDVKGSIPVAKPSSP